MNLSRTIKGVAVVLALVLCFCCLLISYAADTKKRGDAPYCQEECLRHHSEKMRKLSEEYRRTKDWMAYQDKVEAEIGEYSTCLTDCRKVLPVK